MSTGSSNIGASKPGALRTDPLGMGDLRGKVAVITGAGSGFGREFARYAAREGMALVLVDVEADALGTTVAELEAIGAPLMHRRLDVTDGEAMHALAHDAWARYGAVHLLFNNAGVGCTGLVWEASVADWEWVLGVNLWGAIHGLRAFVPRMLAEGHEDASYRAHIVNTASMAGLVDPPLTGPYNVAKHAVVSLSETLHQDLSLVTDRIGCSVLCPSWVGTGIAASDRNRVAAAGAQTRGAAVGRALVEKAVASARLTAAEVARMTFDAIGERRFWILPHPQALDGVRARNEALLAGQAPPDPYAALPQLRGQLVDALRAP
ncbi:SDR family oxidoreductase [Luteimonas saliphila]|uniref:SDR family oxidoreductase n=1 Tax=Luteimonas saliphila TaxID=2804919 RepID=UPI00192D40BA|nr:SDR family oxidoreductase [Luteimonas saliphila]